MEKMSFHCASFVISRFLEESFCCASTYSGHHVLVQLTQLLFTLLRTHFDDLTFQFAGFWLSSHEATWQLLSTILAVQEDNLQEVSAYEVPTGVIPATLARIVGGTPWRLNLRLSYGNDAGGSREVGDLLMFDGVHFKTL